LASKFTGFYSHILPAAKKNLRKYIQQIIFKANKLYYIYYICGGGVGAGD